MTGRFAFAGALLTLALGLILTGGRAMAESRTLSITAAPAEGVAIPAGAVLDVELLDVSRADAPAKRVASQRFRVSGWPALLRLPYDTAAIDPRLDYRVAARLLAGDRVILRTTTAYPVLTRGASDTVRIELGDAAPSAPPFHPGPGLAGVTWELNDLGGRPPDPGEPPTLVFLADGSFVMFGGCNRFRGEARPADGRVTFPDPIAGTMKMCPPRGMEVEKAMLAALRATVGYRRDGPLLVLIDGAGASVARFRKASG